MMGRIDPIKADTGVVLTIKGGMPILSRTTSCLCMASLSLRISGSLNL